MSNLPCDEKHILKVDIQGWEQESKRLSFLPFETPFRKGFDKNQPGIYQRRQILDDEDDNDKGDKEIIMMRGVKSYLKIAIRMKGGWPLVMISQAGPSDYQLQP